MGDGGAFALDEFWNARSCGPCYIGFRNIGKASFHPILWALRGFVWVERPMKAWV